MHPANRTSRHPASRLWMRWVLFAAAAYNLVWGAWIIAQPGALFAWADLAPPRYPMIWQCVGMIVGAYGIGYAIAASDAVRWWPIVLVGLIGKVAGPIGFVQSAATGALPWAFGWTILTNDLIWWVPFTIILYRAWQHGTETWEAALPQPTPQSTAPQALLSACDQHDRPLAELSHQQPLLIVFMRHQGCTFCRQAIADLAAQREALESVGYRLAIVHMGAADDAGVERFFEAAGLADVSRISDPTQTLYYAMGLRRGEWRAVLGPDVWRAGYHATRSGHYAGIPKGDWRQMPGAFVLEGGTITAAYRHDTVGERLNYLALTGCDRGACGLQIQPADPAPSLTQQPA